MKTDHMKKLLNEILLYLWIPLIIALVSYIIFQLQDILLGIIVLVALSAIYTIVRIYFLHRKWWLLVILLVIVLASVGVYFLRVPAYELTINNQKITGTSLTLTEGTITINPAAQGNGQYSKNTVVTLTAEPASGYEWTGWTGTDNDAANPTTITMNGDKQLLVDFELRYTLIINNQQVIGSYVSFPEGSVSVSPAPSNADGKYSHGTRITLTVHPNAGYDWQSWTGTENDYVNPTTVTMNSGQQITLSFSGRFELTINSQTVTGSTLFFDEGSVSIEPSPGGDGKYAIGTTVTLTANPYSGYGWQSWSGTNNLASNPTTVVINNDKHITVNWDIRYLVSINGEPMVSASISVNGGTVTGSPAPGINGSYPRNARVTFTATPDPGYRFGWWGGEGSGTSNTVTIVFNSDKNISAIFVKTYTLTANISPAGGGSISPGTDTYDEGTSVTLYATAAAGYRFSHWDGDAGGIFTSAVVNMTSDKTVTAIFVKTQTLIVTITPVGGGSVSPAGGIYDTGSNVTLTAAPASGYRFDHWITANTTNFNSSISIIMNSDKTVTAVFIKTYTLTVTITPAGGGIVNVVSGVFDEGTIVTLTATPAGGYTFTRWEGDATGTGTTITITMTGNKTITAVFST